MPRDGSNFYTVPAGTEGIPDQTIESAKYNSYIHDIAQDLNTPRPILYGGTGASNIDQALANMGAEKTSQLVTNYDSHLFYPGSFYSASTATNPPVVGHAFAGIVISSDPPAYPATNANLTLVARDLNDTTVPGRVYVREKKASVWSAWVQEYSNITLLGDPQAPTQANTDNDESVATTRFVKNVAVLITGSTMTGPLVLNAAPDTDLKAATKKYVDDKVAAGIASIIVFPAGTQMFFCQTAAPTGWTKVTGYNDRVIRITDGTITAGGATGLTGIASQTTVGSHAVTWSEMPSHAHTAYIWDPTHYHTLNGGNGYVTVGTPIGQCPFSGGNPQCGSMTVQVDYGYTGVRVWDGGTLDQTAVAGGNAGHTHSINLNIAYLDTIIATKN